MKHVIFSNYWEDVYSEESKKDALEWIMERDFFDYAKNGVIKVKDNYGKEVTLNEEEFRKTITDSMIENECDWNNQTWYECEEDNLAKIIDRHESWICIADLGLWNGRRMAYKEVYSDHFLRGDYDYMRCYVDSNGDLRKEESHHDGSNSYLYRRKKDGVTENQWSNFLDKIYFGKCTNKDISRYTVKVGVEIADIYGWKVRGSKKTA